jgi:hypothetical protein
VLGAVDLTVKALHAILGIDLCRLLFFTVPFDYIDKTRFETKFATIAQFSVENDFVHRNHLLLSIQTQQKTRLNEIIQGGFE